MKQLHTLAILLGLLLTTLTFAIFAKPSTPQSKQTVVASWDIDENNFTLSMNLPERLAKVAWHIEQSQYPGQANKHYARAKSLLKPLISHHSSGYVDQTTDIHQLAQVKYLWARVLQHQHQFLLAENILNQAQKLASTNRDNVILLKANVQLAQGQFSKAKETCTQLLGQAQLATVAACTLEATSQLNQPSESYQQMTTLLNNLPNFIENPLNNWLLQIVAGMAMDLGLYDEAQQWLAKGLASTQSLDTKPLSFLVMWADVQLAIGQHLTVLSKLANIVENAGFKDDALLSRLAIAETQTEQTHWQRLFKERVDLRIMRNDFYHAADIARYYLYIHPSSADALYWAELNWQQTKLSDDKSLLEKARTLQTSQL